MVGTKLLIAVNCIYIFWFSYYKKIEMILIIS